VKCPAINAASAEYFRGEDVFGQWLDEDCDLEPGNEFKNETSADLFAAFKAFLIRNGYSQQEWNSTIFGAELSKSAEKKKSGTVSWCGICLKRQKHWFDDER
jgi:phage/plasmid-associated DNA primase